MVFCLRVLLVLSALTSAASVASQAPAAPTNLKSAPGDASVALSWDAPPDALKYTVYYSTLSDVTPANGKRVTGIGLSKYKVTGLTNGTPYYFVVTAVNASGESVPSNPTTQTPSSSAAATAAASGGDNAAESGQATVTGAVNSNPGEPSASKVTTNVGATEATNIQNPDLVYAKMTPTDYAVINVKAGTISYEPIGVTKLVTGSCGASIDTLLRDGSTFTLINVINVTGDSGSQTVKSNNWYIYSEGKNWENGFVGGWQVSDFDGATRLYGAKRLVLLSILLNDADPETPPKPVIDYEITVTQTQPSNVADVSQLLGLVLGSAPNAGVQKKTAETKNPPANYWACSVVPIAYKTSSIEINTSYTSGGGSPFKASQTFTNEAKERWDVSFALPVKKASALQYSSTAGTVTASTINKQSLFAVFDFYPVPVNLSSTSKSFIPSLFGGVAMNSQPLHSLLFGASVGVHLAQVYAGALLLKQQQLQGLTAGGSGTPTQVTSATSYAYKPSFSVGIKISIGAAASSLSKAKK